MKFKIKLHYSDKTSFFGMKTFLRGLWKLSCDTGENPCMDFFVQTQSHPYVFFFIQLLRNLNGGLMRSILRPLQSVDHLGMTKLELNHESAVQPALTIGTTQ